MILVVTLMAVPLLVGSTSSAGVYNPWYDLDDDGDIDIFDVVRMANSYSTSGEPFAAKAALAYDSGWIDIADQGGLSFDVLHGLNVTDWNDPNIMVEVLGQSAPGEEVLRYLGVRQEPSWSATYGRTGFEVAYSMVSTVDGGFALAGDGGGNFWVVKTDAEGRQQWNRTYGGHESDVAQALVQTADGGYAVAGNTRSYGAGDFDFWLVKTDADGNALWNRTRGGTGDDGAYAVVQCSGGGYALAGYTNSFGAGGYDFQLVRTGPLGLPLWTRTYGGADDDWAYALVQTPDGGFAVAGSTLSYGAGQWDFWLIKTDSTGNVQWNQTYGGPGMEHPQCLIQTTDGGFALAGCEWSFGSGQLDFWLVKTDANGTLQWHQSYGKADYDSAFSVVQTIDGGYAVAGRTGDPMGDMWLIKTDSQGNARWNQTYSGGGDDIAHAVVQTRRGELAVAGGTVVGVSWDFWLVKADGESGLAWTGSTADTITLYRGATDPYWNFVRVRVWKIRDSP